MELIKILGAICVLLGALVAIYIGYVIIANSLATSWILWNLSKIQKYLEPYGLKLYRSTTEDDIVLSQYCPGDVFTTVKDSKVGIPSRGIKAAIEELLASGDPRYVEMMHRRCQEAHAEYLDDLNRNIDDCKKG